MSILITICARGGSKGIPGKNIRELAGKPLIEYSVDIAKKFADKYKGVIGVSTDSNEIKSVVRDMGLNVEYQRPSILASDTAGKVDAIRDMLLYEENSCGTKFEYILDLDVTSPLRTMEDLELAFADFRMNNLALTLFSVNNAARNPYFNMVERQPNGFYNLIKTVDRATLTRQSAPQVFDLNASFYFYRREFFESAAKGVITDRSMIFNMKHICFD
ncbi:MAG TPA: acylneuraminate cytidylyltransferase family protein, partial [Pseudosphingobacterium sp.]|nr:acylneuraminate cytidylyltransferase family protein [Pseudosphingobacterium sp.]